MRHNSVAGINFSGKTAVSKIPYQVLCFVFFDRIGIGRIANISRAAIIAHVAYIIATKSGIVIVGWPSIACVK